MSYGNDGLKQIIEPGPSLVQAARTLGGVRHRVGAFPYQWLFPGPDSQHVFANGSAVMPGTAGSAIDLVTYTVESGLRFSLRGVVLRATSSDWVQGSGDIVFNITVQGVGTRPVDWFVNVPFNVGGEQPFPILGRLEFQAEDIITASVTQVNNTAAGFGFAALVGHTYPNFEAGES